MNCILPTRAESDAFVDRRITFVGCSDNLDMPPDMDDLSGEEWDDLAKRLIEQIEEYSERHPLADFEDDETDETELDDQEIAQILIRQLREESRAKKQAKKQRRRKQK